MLEPIGFEQRLGCLVSPFCRSEVSKKKKEKEKRRERKKEGGRGEKKFQGERMKNGKSWWKKAVSVVEESKRVEISRENTAFGFLR